LRGGDFVMQSDGAVLTDFHGNKKYLEGLKRAPLSENPRSLLRPQCLLVPRRLQR